MILLRPDEQLTSELTFDSVHDGEGLKMSAELSTELSSPRVTPVADDQRSFVIEYRHEVKFYQQLLDEEFIHLVCKPERARELKANAGLNTIPTLSRVIRSLQTRSKCPGGASIHLRTITKEVASRCVLYIKGDYLCVKLPSGNESEKGMRALLEYCHFAHVLCIRQLMRASMHALITAIFRRPDMWSNHETNTKLVEEIGLFSDKPAKKLLLHTFKSAIPLLVECNWTDGLPHDSYVVRDIFRMDEKACGKLWVDGKMRVGYAERPQASSAPNGGRKRSVKPMNSGGYGRYNAWDPGY